MSKKYDIEKEIQNLKKELRWHRHTELLTHINDGMSVGALISSLEHYNSAEYRISIDYGYECCEIMIEKSRPETESEFKLRKSSLIRAMERHNKDIDKQNEKDLKEFERLKKKFGKNSQ